MSPPLARAVLAAGVAGGVSRLPALRAAGRLQRVNHRGEPVSLASGPAVALAAVAGAGLPLAATAAAGLISGAVGAYDDASGTRAAERGAKGFHGHVQALRSGQVTSGVVKVVGIGLAGVAGSVLLARDRLPALDHLVRGGVVAGTANLLNLLDLRPGRALKVGLVLALAVGQPGVAAAAGALLPDDLAERTMLGDTGANALGAVLGLALVDRLPGRPATARALTLLAALTAASEVVSYSRVIDATPLLRRLDQLGRRP